MRKNTLHIKTVYECNQCLGNKTLHPQVSIVNLENAKLGQEAVKFGLYVILLIENCPEGCCYGHTYYDYSTATMLFLSPGEIFRMNEANTLPNKGRLLVFHPDLLFRTALKNHIHHYTFFFYRREEALHLSLREKDKIIGCVEAISEELHHPIDMHSSTLISRQIELLLDYCTRFYERQFITREEKNKILFNQLEKLFDNWIESDRLEQNGLPTPEYCAEKLQLSIAYFNDFLKFTTGKTPDEYFQFKRLETSKRLLLKSDHTPTTVARQLGFPSVQHFTQIFKSITGVSPNEYKFSRN